MRTGNPSPTVSVLMPIYNAAEFLPETIDSVLRQSFDDFELLLVNDGSTDDSQQIIDEYASRDKRIIAYKQRNKGLVTTLNETIKKARGVYIARIDADDPSLPNRLKLQVNLFKDIPGLVLVGGTYEIIDDSGAPAGMSYAVGRDEDLRRALLIRNPFGHGGVMYRKDAAIKAGLYSTNHGPTEDYDLWIRMARLGSLAAVVEPIYRYRVVPSGISQSNSYDQAIHTKQHISAQWANYMPRVLSRREILKQAIRYANLRIGEPTRTGIRDQFLYDNVRIGFKLLRYGHVLKGSKQIINVALIGRSGIKATLRHILLLAKLV